MRTAFAAPVEGPVTLTASPPGVPPPPIEIAGWPMPDLLPVSVTLTATVRAPFVGYEHTFETPPEMNWPVPPTKLKSHAHA